MYTWKNWLRCSTVCLRWWRIQQKKANPTTRTIQRNRIAPTTERATVASLLRTSCEDRFGLELVDTRKYSKTISLIASVKLHYCAFKIFPQFWLAKSTRIIHHNQLLMTIRSVCQVNSKRVAMDCPVVGRGYRDQRRRSCGKQTNKPTNTRVKRLKC